MARPIYYPFKAFGFEFPLPWFAVHALAVVVVCAIGWTAYQRVYADPESAIINLKDVNRQLQAEVEEYNLHAMEEPERHEQFEDPDGKLILRVFKDHCVLIQTQTRRGTFTKLVMNLARQNVTAVPLSVTVPRSAGLFPVVEATAACTGTCPRSHEGTFKWWYGERRGEWIEVWRQWPDGCKNVQMFNPTSRVWETNDDGSPKVRWTCCVH
jgi:hypothetical protein